MLRLLYLLSLTAFAYSSSTCTLECRQSAPCVKGLANFTGHPTNHDGSPLSFHAEKKDDQGMHCACPHGWTGLTCDRIYESCDGDHKCYNGGNCIPGLSDHYNNEQLFCDCSDAVDENENHYVGKFCETPTKEYCATDQDEIFCVNGGECNFIDTSSTSFCDCPEAFEGPHCEFQKGSVPKCTLECQSGGECQLGLPSAISQLHDLDEIYLTDTGSAEDSMHCVCPPSFGGKFCDIPLAVCGTEKCYHGGTCVSEMVVGTNRYQCDCTTANFDGKNYAGRFCQFESSETCSSELSENGKLFCVNNGTCLDNVINGCHCPDNYFGASCEYKRLPQSAAPSAEGSDTSAPGTTPAPENSVEPIAEGSDTLAPAASPTGDLPFDQSTECRIKCENSGICRKGAKDLGIISNIAPHVAELNATYNEDFEHCVCPEGFVGLQCQHKAEVCAGGTHVCLHGSSCVEHENDLSCDCAASTAFMLAGSSCQHKSFVTCTSGEVKTVQPRSFCVNGGICNEIVSETEVHPGCHCPDDAWIGPHCELHKASLNSEEMLEAANAQSTTAPTVPSSSSGSQVSVALLIIGILALVTSIVLSVRSHASIKAERRRMEQERQLTSLTAHYETEIKSDKNLAVGEPEVYLGPPHDEDGHELHQIEIL